MVYLSSTSGKEVMKVWKGSCGMNDNFFNLKKEKQDRMINAAMKVFALNGYQHASTDEMVKEAGISKGLWFHYFKNKLGLYSFVYDYSVRYMCLELKSMVNSKEQDLFVLCGQVEMAKMQALKNYPYMQKFLNSIDAENVGEALLAVEEKRQQMEETYEQIWSQADVSRLPAKIDSVRLRKVLEYTVNGIMEERLVDGSFQPEMLYKETMEYVNMLREAVNIGKVGLPI